MRFSQRPCKRSRSSAPHAGLTLVELLAVIAIIGLLAGLLLPAVQRARESARRVSCATTLKQWGLAIQGYEQSYGVLPLGMSEWRCVRHPWIPSVWQYIEQMPLVDRYLWDRHFFSSSNVTFLNANPVGPMTQRLPNYYCPSDSPNASYMLHHQQGVAPQVNYVVNSTKVVGGATRLRGPFRSMSGDPQMTNCGPQAANLLTSGSGLGWVPLDARGYTGPTAWRMSHIVDGLSNTLMMAERVVWPGDGSAQNDLRGWLEYSFFDARFTPNASLDMIPAWFAEPTRPGCINNPPALPCQPTGVNDDFWILAARSRHSGGVQAMMCDGSVRFVSDLIDQPVWQAQGTMNGREAITANE